MKLRQSEQVCRPALRRHLGPLIPLAKCAWETASRSQALVGVAK